MTARALADSVVVLHTLFVLFALAGGALVVAWPRISLVHLPAVAWAAWVEFTGTVCPLTPLENEWRHAAGMQGYEGSFVEHYVVPLLYPAGLTPQVQVVLGVLLVAVNVAFYAYAWRRSSRGGTLAPD